MVLYELTRLKKWYFDKKIKNLPETLFKTSTIVHLILHNIVFKRKVDRIIYYLNNIFFLLSNFRFYCHSKEFFSLEISKFPWLSICQINNGWWCKKKKKHKILIPKDLWRQLPIDKSRHSCIFQPFYPTTDFSYYFQRIASNDRHSIPSYGCFASR